MSTKSKTKNTPASPLSVKVTETRDQKLQRLANARIKQAANKIRLIGNLTAYRPTPEQTDKIMAALQDMCVRVEARLRASKQEVVDFTL